LFHKEHLLFITLFVTLKSKNERSAHCKTKTSLNY
jgi:hypothetical protein